MVPFSFKSERSYSRVMKRYLTDKYWMMGSMDFWINGSSVTSVTLDSIGGKRESREDREDCEVWNSQLLSPKFWLLASARFKPVLKGFKPIYTIQGTLFLSHAERQGLSSEAPAPSEAPAKGDWRRGLGVSASPAARSVRRGGAANDSRGGCAPQNEDGSMVSIIGRHAGHAGLFCNSVKSSVPTPNCQLLNSSFRPLPCPFAPLRADIYFIKSAI